MSPRNGKRKYSSCKLLCLLTTASLFGFVLGVIFKEELFSSLDIKARPAAKITISKAPPFGEQSWENITVCDDSCPTSKDGQCGDGREGHDGEVLCDLGTDCSDCGSWTFQVPSGSAKGIMKPVEQLRNRNVTLRARQTVTVPPFRMPYTDPLKDLDVSAQMESRAVVELGLTQMWFKAMNGKCESANGSRALVADIGANFGWYSFFAAAHGCRVVAWEPVPLFRAFLHYGLQVNNLSRLVTVRDHVVSDIPGKTYNLTVPLQGIWGTASIDGHNIHEEVVGEQREYVPAMSERADKLLQEDVLVLKIDVEGFEPAAFRSASGLFHRHRVHNVFMEYSPGIYEIQEKWDSLQEVPDMLMSLLDDGFTILHANDSWARGSSLLEKAGWKGELPPLEEVTHRNLEHDMRDCQKRKEGAMGCFPRPPELVALNSQWMACNRVPEDHHPKSFRSTFGLNTNVWAAHDRAALVVGAPVGIQDLEQAENEWYGRNPRIGMGGRDCAYIAPPEVLLSHRCPCRVPQCQEEAELVESLAKEGKMSGSQGSSQQSRA